MKFKRLFTVLTLANLLIVSMAISIAGIAYAQDPPKLQDIYPPRNAITAALNTAVSARYNQPMSAATVSSVTFAIHGMQSGLVTETHGVILSNTLIVTPAHSFFQGELVYAIATTRTENISGTHPFTAAQWQFNAGVVKNRCVAGFTDIGAVLTGVGLSSVAWGDYDNDGDLDALLTGDTTGSGTSLLSAIYRNNNGSFVYDSVASSVLTDVSSGSVAWGNYNSDGVLDILLTGQDYNNVPIAEVYRNSNGMFTHDITASAALTGVLGTGSIAWGDYDNDGDLDILLTGEDSGGVPVSEIYRNNGGTFIHDANASASLPDVMYSSVAWGDYDNDGNLDILLTGRDSGNAPVSEVYRNNGSTFIRDAGASAVLTNLDSGSAAWGDYDNDGDLDILLTGEDSGGVPVSEVYRNNGGTFIYDAIVSAVFTDVVYGRGDWGDYDNDGDLDILLSGGIESGVPIPHSVTEIYRNDGGTFTRDITVSNVLSGVVYGSIDWGDYDNDGDLDILLSGVISSGLAIAKIYRNDDCVADLTLSKTAVPTVAVAGEFITYTLRITNSGGLTALNALLSDTLPASVTLRGFDQTDNTQAEFDAGTHANTHWVDPRPGYNNNDEWLAIDNTALVSGVFTSRVMDAQNIVPWQRISWRGRRPYWKPLPNNGAAEEDYRYGNANMLGNRLLLHLDGGFTDTSGLGNNGACLSCPAPAGGRFGGAFSFNSALSQSVIITDAHQPLRYAIEVWVYPTALTDTSFILRSDSFTATAARHSQLLGIVNGHFQHTLFDGARKTITAPTPVLANTWYHLVGTAESNGDMKLFVNGSLAARQDGVGSLWSGGNWYRLGASYALTHTEMLTGSGSLPLPVVVTDTTAYFSGRLDEVAVYSRTLSSGEVLAHYLRGALRLGFQARACADAACAGQTFVGPDGTPATYYSEQENYTVGAYPAADLQGIASPARYFQYRAALTSDAPAYSPELLWVRIRPEHPMIYASQGQCLEAASGFTCSLESIAPGGLVTVTAFAQVDPSARGVITNTAFVTASNSITASSAFVTNSTVSEVEIFIGKYDDDYNVNHIRRWEYGAADPVNPGSVMTYILQIYNDGPSTAWNVKISDTLPITPSGWFTDGNWNPACSLAGRVISCTAASLPRYTWRHLVITGTAPLTEGVITNTAWVSAGNSAVYTTSRISDTESTLITPLADLQISKSASPDPVEPGAALTFTVTVTNSGPSTATGVIITDVLNISGTVVGTYASGCHPASGVYIICGSPAVTIPPGLSTTFQITATAPVSGMVVNFAQVGSATYDPDTDNNTAYAYAAVLPVADLQIIKRDSPDPVYAGAPLTYTLTLSNNGYVDAGVRRNVMSIEDRRPIHIPWGGQAYPYPAVFHFGGLEGRISNITVTLNSLTHTYPADLEVLLVGPEGNSAVLMANAGGGADANATLTINDSGAAMPLSGAFSSSVIYRPTNYGLIGDLPAPAPAGPYGGSLSVFSNGNPNGRWELYIFDTYGSDGGDLLNGWRLEIATLTTDTITLSDALPAELTITGARAPQGWQRLSNHPLVWRGQSLPVGAARVFTVTATAPITGGVITNTAVVSATTLDVITLNNRSVVTTTVLPAADLQIVKQVTPADEVIAGETLTYTLTVSNGGVSHLPDAVTVTDYLPAVLSNVMAAGCDVSALPTVTCVISGGLTVSQTARFTITATAPLTPGVITNTAGITAAVYDPLTANNTSVVTLTVIPRQADLQIVKQVVPADEVIIGEALTYTLAVSNAGPHAILSAVTVTDYLPAELTGVGATGCNASALPTVTCVISGGLTVSQTARFTITATAPLTPGVITNTAGITAAVYDPLTASNTSVVTLTVIPRQADLQIVKQVDPSGVVREGEALTYTLTVSNAGPHAILSAVTVTDYLPAELTGVGAAGCDVLALPTVTCVLSGGLAVSQSARFTITAAAPMTMTVITNTATVTSAVSDPQPGNNAASVALNVWPPNRAPVFTSTPVLTARENSLYSYNVVAVDPDIPLPGDTLTMTVWPLPTWLTLVDHGGGLAALSGTPSAGDVGLHSVGLQVTDSGGLTDTQVFTITVSPDTFSIYLPLIMKNYAVAPDLVVDNLLVSANAVTVTIKNQGPKAVENLSENEFWVDVYINPSSPPVYNQTWEHLCSQGMVWGVTQSALPLNPGDVLTLTVGGAYYRPDKSTMTWPLQAADAVWAQVDSGNQNTTYGAVLENHEITGSPYNNVSGPVLP